jgi:hypothetical protein
MKIEGMISVASTVVGPGWVPIACDLTQFRGRDVEIVLSTSARGDPNYDWAVFGRPEILLLSNERYAAKEEISRGRLRFTSEMQGAEAVAVVEVIEPSSPVALMASRETIELASGAPGIPVEMGWIARRFTPPPGAETIRISHLAGVPRQCSVYHLVPTLEIEEFGPVTAFPVLGKNTFGLRITNKGPGYYRPGGEPLEIQIRDATDTVGESEEIYRMEGPPEIAPGESVVLRRSTRFSAVSPSPPGNLSCSIPHRKAGQWRWPVATIVFLSQNQGISIQPPSSSTRIPRMGSFVESEPLPRWRARATWIERDNTHGTSSRVPSNGWGSENLSSLKRSAN